MEGDNTKQFRKELGKGSSDGKNQERAQYGRLSVNALYHILDALMDGDGGLAMEAVGPVNAFMDIGMVSNGIYIFTFYLNDLTLI